jgi:hypothetical protein
MHRAALDGAITGRQSGWTACRLGPHTGEIMGDIPNSTRIRPVAQVSEVRL